MKIKHNSHTKNYYIYFINLNEKIVYNGKHKKTF